MGNLIIRGVDDDLITRLKLRAAAHFDRTPDVIIDAMEGSVTEA
jgi:plasmid stability protein